MSMSHRMTAKQRYELVNSISIVFILCFVARMIEYLLIRTDQTFFAENFIHKLLGILILAICIRRNRLSWSKIGFKREDFLKRSIQGLSLGFFVFLIAYGYEFLMMNKSMPSFSWYVSAYSSSGNQGESTGIVIFSLCIFFNLVNVVMEEGVFRGLFFTLMKNKTTFMKANIISAVFFGLWHIAMPLRSMIDGEMSLGGGVMFALSYMVTTFMMAFAIGLWVKITGSLWVGVAEHFVNNTIVNLLQRA